jgi:hypothetical protein
MHALRSFVIISHHFVVAVWHIDFFFTSRNVITMLTTKGSIEIDKKAYEAMLEKPLACHKCKVIIILIVVTIDESACGEPIC